MGSDLRVPCNLADDDFRIRAHEAYAIRSTHITNIERRTALTALIDISRHGVQARDRCDCQRKAREKVCGIERIEKRPRCSSPRILGSIWQAIVSIGLCIGSRFELLEVRIAQEARSQAIIFSQGDRTCGANRSNISSSTEPLSRRLIKRGLELSGENRASLSAAGSFAGGGQG